MIPTISCCCGAIQDARRHLDQIKRFDMPDFKPRAEYVREMKRYGILPDAHQIDDPIDVYAVDRAYWRSTWYQAPGTESQAAGPH